MSTEMFLVRVIEVCLVVLAIGGLYAWRRWKIRWRAKQWGHGFEEGRREVQKRRDDNATR
jgi:hypothetical protein